MINGKCYEGCEVMTKFGKLEAHLLTRNYRHDVHPYRQWIDESEGVVTFPLYRFDGMLAGYQTYRPGVQLGFGAFLVRCVVKIFGQYRIERNAGRHS